MSKRKYFSLEEKVKIITYAEENPQLGSRKLAVEFGCGRTCIQTLMKQKEVIMTDWKCSKNSSLKKKGKSEEYQDINNAIWRWFCMAREALIPVSGPMIQEEALQIASKLNVAEFTASNGWLEKWKNRHNVKQFSVAGEDGQVNAETLESWAERLPEIVKGYELKDIWNADETGLFWRALPDKSLSVSKGRCKGGKYAKQRITVLLIANALGEKETPVIIGHSQKPRCFKNVQDKKPPCGTYYYANKKAWMDSELMEEILRTLNRKCAADDRKILLFIDNAPSHPESFIDCFSHVKVVFLPKNTTSKLQPLDAGIIKNFKVFYRKQLLQHVLARIKPGCKASDVIGSVDLLKSIGWVMNAWGKVKKETIVNCFSKCGFTEATLELFTDDDVYAEFAELQSLISEISPDSTVDSYLNQDEDAVTSVGTVDIHSTNWKENLREAAICCAIEGDDEIETPGEVEDDFDIERPELKIKSSQAALSIVDDLNNFCETLGDADLASALNLVTIRLEALRLKNVSQKKVTDYFSKNL